MRRRPEREQQYKSAAYRDLIARLAHNARAVREERGWTQEEAAHRCEMATLLLQRVEAGATNVTATTIARLCAGLHEDPQRLFAPSPKLVRRQRGRPASTK